MKTIKTKPTLKKITHPEVKKGPIKKNYHDPEKSRFVGRIPILNSDLNKQINRSIQEIEKNSTLLSHYPRD